MTATVTELEILEEVDLEAELPCETVIIHERTGSTESAKFKLTARCDYCDSVDFVLICEPCLKFCQENPTNIGHVSCPALPGFLRSRVAPITILNIQEL